MYIGQQQRYKETGIHFNLISKDHHIDRNEISFV